MDEIVDEIIKEQLIAQLKVAYPESSIESWSEDNTLLINGEDYNYSVDFSTGKCKIIFTEVYRVEIRITKELPFQEAKEYMDEDLTSRVDGAVPDYIYDRLDEIGEASESKFEFILED